MKKKSVNKGFCTGIRDLKLFLLIIIIPMVLVCDNEKDKVGKKERIAYLNQKPLVKETEMMNNQNEDNKTIGVNKKCNCDVIVEGVYYPTGKRDSVVISLSFCELWIKGAYDMEMLQRINTNKVLYDSIVNLINAIPEGKYENRNVIDGSLYIISCGRHKITCSNCIDVIDSTSDKIKKILYLRRMFFDSKYSN